MDLMILGPFWNEALRINYTLWTVIITGFCVWMWITHHLFLKHHFDGNQFGG